MKIYSEFKNMPWKNGKGSTTELIKLDSQVNSNEFDFRLSRAKIDSPGSFSQFLGLKRILILLNGQGINLNINQQSTVLLNTHHVPFYFSGDDNVSCELIDGICLDFNIIYNPNIFQVSVEHHQIKENQIFHFTASERTFLYYIADENVHEFSDQLLMELEQNEKIKKTFKYPGHLYSVVLTSPK